MRTKRCRRFSCVGIAVALVGVAVSSQAVAQQAGACSVITRSNVASCATRASLAVRAEQLGVSSFEGRRRAAAVFLPSNPTVSVTGGHSIEPTVAARDRELLWSASVSQELEVAGQRGKRLAVVAAEERAQAGRSATARRDAATDAFVLYFDAIAAREEAKLADRLAKLATALTTVAAGRAQAGLASDVEAQVARAAAVRLIEARLHAERRVATTTAALASALGVDPNGAGVRVEGELLPLGVPDLAAGAMADAALQRRSEVVTASSERDVQTERVALLERMRVPNPTVSVFVKNDWINERLVGAGLSIPIPLPAPTGRTYAGDIAEASALASRSSVELERVRRTVRLEVVNAAQALRTRRQQVDLFDPQQVRQSEDTLRDIADELQARRLPVREALLTQQAIIDYLSAHLEARRQLCLASVELMRAAGLPPPN